MALELDDAYEEALADMIRAAYPGCTDWQIERRLYDLDRLSADEFTRQVRLMAQAGERNKRKGT